jgi:8-oxo-dGTP pyrophosphatase MutT (NUDIX family)
MSPAAARPVHEAGPVILASENYIEYQEKFLLHRRSPSKSRFPNYLIGPGGRIDAGEDVITAAVREIREETGVAVPPPAVRLKVVAIHHHLDRAEIWVNFITLTKLTRAPDQLRDSDEGTSEWLTVEQITAQDKVFPPSQVYFEHVLGDRPGIMYTNSEWRGAELVRVLSQTTV